MHSREASVTVGAENAHLIGLAVGSSVRLLLSVNQAMARDTISAMPAERARFLDVRGWDSEWVRGNAVRFFDRAAAAVSVGARWKPWRSLGFGLDAEYNPWISMTASQWRPGRPACTCRWSGASRASELRSTAYIGGTMLLIDLVGVDKSNIGFWVWAGHGETSLYGLYLWTVSSRRSSWRIRRRTPRRLRAAGSSVICA